MKRYISEENVAKLIKSHLTERININFEDGQVKFKCPEKSPEKIGMRDPTPRLTYFNTEGLYTFGLHVFSEPWDTKFNYFHFHMATMYPAPTKTEPPSYAHAQWNTMYRGNYNSK